MGGNRNAIPTSMTSFLGYSPLGVAIEDAGMEKADEVSIAFQGLVVAIECPVVIK